MTKVNINKLIRGGYTCWQSCPVQRHGYLVAVDKYGMTVNVGTETSWRELPTATKREIRRWIKKVSGLHYYTDELGIPNENCLNFDECCTIGSWLCDGTLYLDTCNWYSNLEVAIAAGHLQNQLAIWDLTNNREISLVAAV